MAKPEVSIEIATGISYKKVKEGKEWKGVRVKIGEVEFLAFPRPYILEKIEEAIKEK